MPRKLATHEFPLWIQVSTEIPSFSKFPPHVRRELILAVCFCGDFFWYFSPCRPSQSPVLSGAMKDLTREFLNTLSQFSQVFSDRRDKSPWVLARCCPLGIYLQRPWPRTTNLSNGICQCTRNVRRRHHSWIVGSLQLEGDYVGQNVRSEGACITVMLFKLGLRRQAFSALEREHGQQQLVNNPPHTIGMMTFASYESAMFINSIILRCNRHYRIVLIARLAMLSS